MIYSIPGHRYFSLNTKGRDYFAGDLHGKYNWLCQALDRVGFNTESDRLFSVGDLIDRGEDSMALLKLCNEPWFFPVLGNHEHMLLSCKDEEWMRLAHWYPNGGSWWESASNKEKALAEELILANFAFTQTVETPLGDIAIVHADVPEGFSWATIKSESLDEKFIDYCLWSRRRITRYIQETIRDVRLVILGHTPLPEPLLLGNCLFLDTGAGHFIHRYLPDPRLSLATQGSSGELTFVAVGNRGVVISEMASSITKGKLNDKR